MARDLPAELRKLLDEALQQEIEELKASPRKKTATRNWPDAQVRSESIAEVIEASIGFPEHVANKLESRLCAFEYPYPDGTRKGTTFYEYLRNVGLLRWCLSWYFLWVVGLAWFLRRSDDMDKYLRKRKLSHHGFNLAFHREMMQEVFRHLQRISQIGEKYRIPQQWFGDYRKILLKVLSNQAAAFYYDSVPGLYYEVPSRARHRSRDVSSQMMVLDAIEKRLAERKRKNNGLAYQLTALICSSPECINRRALCPDPETVRSNDRARKGRKSKRK